MIDFPTSPIIGQVYPPGSVPEGNKQWKWNGQGWELMMYSAAQVVEMARLASNASASAQQAVDNAALSAQYKTDAQEAATTAGSIAGGMENAIAFANTFAAVPSSNQGPMVVVTQPHLRFMVWNGTKYVRAPWHMPGVLFFSHAPAASVTQGIQVRADVTYNTADQPDLAEMLGVVGPTFILPEGRARVLRAADNGRGIDSALVNGYLQEDAIRNLTGSFGTHVSSSGGAIYEGGPGNGNGVFVGTNKRSNYYALGSLDTVNGGSGNIFPTGFDMNVSQQVPTAAENRVKSLSATLYITK